MNHIKNNIKNFLLLVSCLALVSCGAMHKSIKHGKLETQTKMSETIFLNPVSDNKKTIYIQIRNTSDKRDLNITQELKTNLLIKGYKVVDNLDNAQFLLQVNILQVGKSNLENPFESLQGGYGGAIQGAVAGAAIGSLAGDGDGAIMGGLIGGVIGTVADASVQVNQYTMITDLQISERAEGVVVEESSEAKLKQGTSGNKISKWSQNTNWKKYQTRVISLSKKVNLKFEDALPQLKDGLVQSVSGIF